jgi:NADH-quinone oxidoreductase subunit J
MFLFTVFSAIAVVAATGVIISRKPVYSALFLLVNFATLAALYIMVEAQFLAAVQIIIYAGAIVVLFLFVVMLIGGGELGPGDREAARPEDRPTSTQADKARVAASPRLRVAPGWQRITALVLAVLLLAGLGYGLITGQLHPARGDVAVFGQGSTEAIAATLYTEYLLPFELTSVLLLVGMLGAIVLARRSEE